MPRPRSQDPPPPPLLSRRRRDTILRDLGRAPGESAVFVLPSRLLPVLLPLPFAFFLYRATGGSLPEHASLAILLASLFLVVLAILPAWLVVGLDGITVQWLGSRRFVSYADLAEIEVYDFWFDRFPGLRIGLRSGRDFTVCTSMGLAVWNDRWTERDAIFTLIQASREEFAARGRRAADPGPEAIARGGRSHAEWVRVLRAIGRGARATMRVAPVSEDRLLRVIEDPTAPASARTAAVIALRGAMDDGARRRVDAALDATALPEARRSLRVAVEADDDATLARALEEAEALDEAAHLSRGGRA